MEHDILWARHKTSGCPTQSNRKIIKTEGVTLCTENPEQQHEQNAAQDIEHILGHKRKSCRSKD